MTRQRCWLICTLAALAAAHSAAQPPPDAVRERSARVHVPEQRAAYPQHFEAFNRDRLHDGDCDGTGDRDRVHDQDQDRDRDRLHRHGGW